MLECEEKFVSILCGFVIAERRTSLLVKIPTGFDIEANAGEGTPRYLVTWTLVGTLLETTELSSLSPKHQWDATHLLRR